MKVGSLNVAVKGGENIERVLTCTEQLFKQLFMQAQTSNKLSIMNNFLLMYLGLIKVSRSVYYNRQIYRIYNCVFLE